MVLVVPKIKVFRAKQKGLAFVQKTKSWKSETFCANQKKDCFKKATI